jgi:hypothetical protein
MRPAFPTSNYYEGSAPPRGQQPTASLPANDGQPQDGSHVHRRPIDGGGAQLFPLHPRHEYAADLPHGLRASHEIPTPESPTRSRQACTAPRPTSARLEPMPRLRGFSHWFALATPSRLACRVRAVWQCRPVPSSSRLLPSTPCASKAGLPPASATRCDGPPLDLSFHSVIQRLVAHSALTAQPGESQGRPQRCCRALSPAQARPAQPTFPKSPCPGAPR